MVEQAIPVTIMRGGTSRGLFFNAEHLPDDNAVRDRVIAVAMGSPDPQQIDGLGGGHPLTSKVAVVSRSSSDDADVDYLFLQVAVGSELVSDSQNCGNILAGVGPFAIEQGFVDVADGFTVVRIRMLNSGGVVTAKIPTPGGKVTYSSDISGGFSGGHSEGSSDSSSIDAVPGASPIRLDFKNLMASGSPNGLSDKKLLPTGRVKDEIKGIPVTCIDNGMSVVLINAGDLALNGYEDPEVLEANSNLREKLEEIRLEAGQKMGLGDVTEKTVPKMCLLAKSQNGGLISTRTFIPHRVHTSIGVFGALTVATACYIQGSIAYPLSNAQRSDGVSEVEHPSGHIDVDIEIENNGDELKIVRSVLLRTARKIMQGTVFIPDVENSLSEAIR